MFFQTLLGFKEMAWKCSKFLTKPGIKKKGNTWMEDFLKLPHLANSLGF